jgi:hypothetical protein
MRWLESLPHRCSLAFDAQNTAPRAARKYLSRVLPEWSLSEFQDSASLIVTELVTNSLQEIDKASWSARRPPIRLWLRGGPSVLLVSAWDAIAEPPVPRDAGDDDENGRGLAIVTSLSARWGFYFPADYGGKVTWAAIDTP